MATPVYDALIVGARIAGATVAARLAQQGRKVLLVDRDEFPSDTISTHALGFNAVDSLRRVGVLDGIEAAGFRRIFRHRAWVEDTASWIRCSSRWIGFATHSLRISTRRKTSSLGSLSLKA